MWRRRKRSASSPKRSSRFAWGTGKRRGEGGDGMGGEPAPGGHGGPADEGVTVTAIPTEARQEGAKRTRVGHLAKVDAIYYFLDLSPGSYIVRAIHERTEDVGERTVSVSSSEEGRVRMAVADLKL